MNILLMTPFKIYEGWPFPIDGTCGDVPSATLPQLAAMITDKHNVRILDGTVYKMHVLHFKKIIQRFHVIGISITTPYMALNAEICIRLIRRFNPDVRIIMGGHHPTFYAERWLKKGVDVVVRHEGENSLKEVVEAFANNLPLDNIKGISWICNNTVINNPDRPLCADLNNFPVPRWDLINLDIYDFMLPGPGKTACPELSRGCPNRCNFCMVGAMWKGTQRTKSFEKLLEEFDLLYNLGVRKMLIADDNFAYHTRIMEPLFKEMVKRRYNFSFAVFIRADTILHNKELMKLAAKAGMKLALVGYESKQEQNVTTMEKGLNQLTVKDYKEIYSFLSSIGVTVLGFYLTSYPGQTTEYIRETFATNPADICDYISVNTFVPLKGTNAFEMIEKQGLKVKDMFYHLQNFTSFETQETVYYSNVFHLTKWLLSPTFLKKTFAGNNPVKKSMFRTLYRVYFKNFLSLTIRRFTDFLILQNPFTSREERQKIIVRRYTGISFINSLIENNSIIGRRF